MNTVTVNHAMLHAAITSAVSIAPKSESRYYLVGVCLTFKSDALRVSSTDGHRLFDVRIPAYVPDELRGRECIIDRAGAMAWSKAAKPPRKYDADEMAAIDVVPGESRIESLTIRGESCQPIPPYAFKLDGSGQGAIVDGAFPDIDRVIPGDDREPDNEIGLNLQYLADALKCLKAFCNPRHQGAIMKTGGANECVKFETTGPDFEHGDGEPVKAVYVVMPMRL